MRVLTTIFLALLLVACGTKQEENVASLIQPKVIEAKGYVVPKDSMAPPVVVQVDESKLTKIPAGEPKVVPTNTNVHAAGEPRVVEVGAPRVCIPGQDTFAMPLVVSAIDSPFIAGVPEVVIAKDRAVKDQNAHGFSTYSKLQGLKHTGVRGMLQDKSGNIWFATYGGGASKYDGKAFTYFTEKEGLCNNTIYSILEDKNGNLWFGTWGGGVSKYDGKNFTHYTVAEGLSNNFVLSILEDIHGNLWFGTNGGGVSKYNGKTFTHYAEREGLSNSIYSILEDRNGDLWFGSDGGGVSKFDGTSFTHYTEREGLSNNIVLSILEDKTGSLWFGTGGGGACKFDGTSFTHYTEQEGLSNNVVCRIFEDDNGTFWFGTWGGGISKFDGSTFTHLTEKEGLSNNIVWSILEDETGALWFGTIGGGVSKYDGAAFTHYNEKEGLSNNFVYSILEDKAGSLWFGTWGGGLSKFDGTTFTHYTEAEGLSNNTVWSILQDKTGNLWFGTGGGGVSKFDGTTFTHYTEKDGLSNNIVYSIIEDRRGNFWFGTDGGGVSKFDGSAFTNYTEREGLSNNSVNVIYEDELGNLWFGTWGGGVSKFDGSIFTHYTEKEGLSSNIVLSIMEDKNGNLWFCTHGGGMSKYDGKTFTHFMERQGLSNDFVSSVLQDDQNNIYAATRFGLNRISERKMTDLIERASSGGLTETDVFFKHFSYEDGYLGIGLNGGNAMLQDRNGTIWTGSNDRLTAFHPENVQEDTTAPNIQLTSIGLFNEAIPWPLLKDKQDSSFALKNGMRVADYSFSDVSRWYSIPENLSLAYNNNFLIFNFIGITMNQPKRVKYQYKLVGMDENWSGVTSRNEATYGNLPHGTYTFLVKAMNSEGLWSEPFQYTFTIRPPWWKTWWAYSFYMMISMVSFTIYLRWRDRAAIKRRRALEQKVTEATAEIRSQKEMVEKQKEEVEKQKKRSDELLLNILPEQVAEELKERGEAEAKLMDNVTVLFTDFKGFTQLSEKLTPQELVSQIHEYFSAFDAIVVKYGIEKIKTIGDAYMAAGGLPEMNETHAHDVIMAAIEINAYMLAQRQKRQASGEPFFEIRIGIHTGPVVAGIVGVKKFQYDIWGDTVNTASRMESAGEPGKINISGSTYRLIKDRFNCEYRGEIDAKGKGKMKMYFVSDVARA